MPELAGVPSHIADKLIDTIQESNKQIASVTSSVNECSKDVESLIDVTKKIVDQVTTPPRHVEIYSKVTEISNTVAGKDGVSERMAEVKRLITAAVREIKISFTVVAIAILIAAIVTTGVNYYMDKAPKSTSEIVHEDLKKEISELKKTIEALIKDNEKLKDKANK